MPCSAVGAVTLAGCAAVWASGGPGSVAVVLLVSGGVCAAGVAAWMDRRGRAVRRLDRFARRMLSEARPDAPRQATPMVDEEASEASGLARTLADLQHALRTQTRELAKKTRNLEALIDGLDEPVLVFDDNDCVLLNNRSAEAMVGARPGGLLRRGVREIFTRPELAAMHQAARAGETRRGRVSVLGPQGTRTLQVSATPLPPAWGEGVFGSVLVLRDVTELAQAVQLKTDFVGSASHELRTPVAAIRAAVETLQDGAKEEPAVRDRMLRMIESHTLRLDDMVRDLLDLSRLESPEAGLRLGTVETGELRANLEQLFEAALREKGISLAFELDEAGAVFEGDARLLLTALRNLIENSIKHSGARTVVRVAMRRVPAPADAPVTLESAGGVVPWLRFEVIDRGSGIPLAHQERVFERFYQVDPARTGGAKRGTGLGLAIVKHAVRTMEGRTGLVSEWGQGTTVWFEIPAPAASVPSA
ncbi:MAG: sensor histidine kinase [Phycisphaerales bacterium]